tara:strand:- start:688 stop:1608 length:921 start_codon:yes stop_codon:yes gene_type:complete
MKKNFFLIVSIGSILALLGSCAKDDDSSTSTLSAPTGVTATGGESQVVLDWTALSGASSYTVYWGSSTGISSSSTAISSVSTDNYTHTGLDNGTTYYYKVAAVDSAGTAGTLSSEVNAKTHSSFTSTTTASGSITVGSVAMSGTYVSGCNTSGVAAAVSGGYFPSDIVANRDVLVVTGNDNVSQESHFYTDTTCSTLSGYSKNGWDNFTVGDASGDYYKVTYQELGYKNKAGTAVWEAFYENYFSTNNITASGTTIDLVVDTEYDVGGSGYTEMNLFYVSSTTVRHGDDDNATQPTEMDTLEMAKQ